MSQGLAEMLATDSGPMPKERGEYAAEDYRKLAEESLKAAHGAMQRGQYSEACNHMADWSEHNSKIDYNQPSPGQKDHDGDDDASSLIIVSPEKMGGGGDYHGGR